jgi:ABC-type polysaccharide/polyol phosphate transport system ATPase subunit
MSLSNDIAVELKNVFERYDVEILLDGKSTRESFEALRNITFSVRQGEAVAIIGPNGAGKSTLLRLIAGLLAPEKGEVKVHGRVGSLLDLGAGFHPELTGRDNLLLNASLYHFSREELDKKYEDILKFADIGKFINAPVRCYSQGMYVRLAFSLAIHVDPDIILIDDCLAVGDDDFRTKSLDKALELKAKNKTIIFVTHDFNLAKQMCERGLYIKEGRIVADANIDTAILRYLKPFEVDKERYKYLGAKIEEANRLRETEAQKRLQEEERRRLEEEKRLKAEAEQRKLEEEKRLKEIEERWRLEEEKRLKAMEERRRLEEEKRLKMEEERWRLNWRLEEEKRLKAEEKRLKEEEERRRFEEERRRLEREKRKQGYVLFCGPSLKLIISPDKVQIIHNNREITSHHGVRSHFMVGGENLSSSAAIWRVKKNSDMEILCCLRWPKPTALFQAWYFKSLGDGAVDFKIMMRTRETLPIENKIVEYCLRTPCKVFDEDRLGNKATVFSCSQEQDFLIKTLRKDQISGIRMEGKDGFRPYFLTIPEHSSSAETSRRCVYFEGRFTSGVKAIVAEGPSIISHELKTGRTRINFQEGSCQLVWGEKQLTTGLGIYTSLYSKGIWYDSTQARWKIKASSQGQLVVEGFWPWIPVAQVWEIILKNEKKIILNANMKIFQETPINMQETVMMLSAEYKKWNAGKEIKEFPEEFTSDDFFRFCLWANKADGVSSLSSHADHLPTVTFKPDSMQGHRIIVENSAHIYGVQSRLFHCLRVNKKEETYYMPGEYEFFKGLINLKEE